MSLAEAWDPILLLFIPDMILLWLDTWISINLSVHQVNTMYKFSGSPRVEGDNEEDDVDDVENEFNHMHGSGQATLRWQQGEDVNISSSSRRDSQPIPLRTNGQRVSYKDKKKKFLRCYC